jgi:hypothetical protein
VLLLEEELRAESKSTAEKVAKKMRELLAGVCEG